MNSFARPSTQNVLGRLIVQGVLLPSSACQPLESAPVWPADWVAWQRRGCCSAGTEAAAGTFKSSWAAQQSAWYAVGSCQPCCWGGSKRSCCCLTAVAAAVAAAAGHTGAPLVARKNFEAFHPKIPGWRVAAPLRTPQLLPSCVQGPAGRAESPRVRCLLRVWAGRKN